MIRYAAISPTGQILKVGDHDESVGAAKDVGIVIDDGVIPSVADQNPNPLPTVMTAVDRTHLPPVSEREVKGTPLHDAYLDVLPIFEKLGVGRKTGDMHDFARGLLTSNYKMDKRIDGMDEVRVEGLSLLPHSLAEQKFREYGLRCDSVKERGFTLCAGSNQMCRDTCLVFTGHNTIIERNAKVKTARTFALLKKTKSFIRILMESVMVRAHTTAKRKIRQYVRLNVLSDIPWEVIAPWMLRDAQEASGGMLSFYDYTKVARRNTPDNYDLTFSFSGTNSKLCERELDRGRRVAVVFLGMRKKGSKWVGMSSRKGQDEKFYPLPDEMWGRRVVDGDVSDLRPLDPAGVVVGLRFKTPIAAAEKVDPTDKKFSFVTPVFVVNGESIGFSMPDTEVALVPITPRYQEPTEELVGGEADVVNGVVEVPKGG